MKSRWEQLVRKGTCRKQNDMEGNSERGGAASERQTERLGC
jgi:hypothetical protein